MSAYIKTFGENDKYEFKYIQSYDANCLKEKDREIFVIIQKEDTSLRDTTDDRYEYIEGRVTGGTGNIDGSSAVRRTCSGISIVSNQTNIHEHSWALHTDIRIYIGVKNATIENFLTGSDSLDSVLYFDMGTYALSSFSLSQNVNSSNINISGKDKMCLLNGELGGLFTVDTELDKDVDGNTKTLFEIGESLLGLAGITKYNIDALKEHAGKELLEYRGDSPLYLLMDKNENTNTYDIINLTIFGDQLTIEGKPLNSLTYGVEPIAAEVGIIRDIDDVGKLIKTTHYVQKIEYGEVAGYRWCDLIYPGSLTAAAGESIASIFEKIKNVLGAYEYFFDTDGMFWFKKQAATLGIQVSDNNIVVPSNLDINIQYEFNDLSLFTSLNNSPALQNFKNDFIIRGNRKSVSGENKTPIHARYAIVEWPTDPELGVTELSYEGKTALERQGIYNELIYQWAQNGAKSENNKYGKYWDAAHRKYYQNFSSDILAFWRDIYNPDATEEPIKTTYDAVGDYEPNSWYGIEEIDMSIYDTLENKDIVSELGKKYNLENIFVEADGKYCKFPDYYIDLTKYENIYKLEGSKFISVYDWWDFGSLNLYVSKDRKNYTTIPASLDTKSQGKIQMKTIEKEGNYIPYLEYINVNKILSNDQDIQTAIRNFGLWVKLGAGNYLEVDTLSTNSGSYAPEALVKEWWKSYDRTATKLYFKLVGSGTAQQVTDHQFFVRYPRTTSSNYKYFMEDIEIIEDQNGNTSERVIYKDLTDWCLEHNKFTRNQLYVKSVDKDNNPSYTHLLDIMELDKNTKLYAPSSTIVGEYELIIPDYKRNPKPLFVFKQEGTIKGIGENKKFLHLPYYKCKADGSLNTNMTYYNTCLCFYLKSDYYLPGEKYAGWKKAYIEDPSLLPYELILIDPNRQGNTLLSEYTISKAGSRQKVANENAVTAVRFNETPLLYFKNENNTGLGFQMPEDTKHLFVISSQGQSAKDAAAQLLYNFTYCTETLSASIWPFYDLEPNKRISILYEDNQKETYIISKISFSLTYNGMMNLTLIRDPITRLEKTFEL